MGQGVEAIVAEWEANGTAEDKECLDYVLRQRANSNPKRWPHSGGHQMDTFEGGHPPDGRAGQPLRYFVDHPNAKRAALLEEHVLCLRLYTTAAFKVMAPGGFQRLLRWLLAASELASGGF